MDLRALVLAPDFPPARGGIQTLTNRLASGCSRLDVRVLALNAPSAREFDQQAGCQVKRVGPPRPVRDRRRVIATLNARALLEAYRYRPNVVVSTHIVTSPAAWLIRRSLGTQFLQFAYGKEITERRRLAAFAARNSAAVVAVSAYTAWLLADVSLPSRPKIVQIAPGVDSRNGDDHADERADNVILTVARLADRYKGHDIIIRALPLIRAKLPSIQWIVAGDGPLRPAYERLAASLGVTENVRFLGNVSDEVRDQWLRRSSLFVMPSRISGTGGGEGFGIVYLEAASYGMPAIGGNAGGCREAIEDGVTGLLVDPEDHVALAAAVTDLLLDKPRARAMGEAAQSRARTFDWQRVTTAIEDLLIEIAAAKA